MENEIISGRCKGTISNQLLEINDQSYCQVCNSDNAVLRLLYVYGGCSAQKLRPFHWVSSILISVSVGCLFSALFVQFYTCVIVFGC